MTLIEYIKSQLSNDTPLGDLAQDIHGDKEFPAEKTEEEIISYLDFKTRSNGTHSIFESFLKGYKDQKEIDTSILDVDIDYSVLSTEKWKYYKENFRTDKVVLVGQPTDFYKAYCIDSKSGKALYFDIKSSFNLNNIEIVDEKKIHIGNFTEQVSVDRAISLLENCPFDTPIKPDKERFGELIEFLNANN